MHAVGMCFSKISSFEVIDQSIIMLQSKQTSIIKILIIVIEEKKQWWLSILIKKPFTTKFSEAPINFF